MNKIQEIFKAWQIAYNPNDLQSALAIDRMQICDTCDSKKEIPFIHCGECMCALKAKIYTPKTFMDEGGSCPEKLWKGVEVQYLKTKNLNRYNELKK